MFSIFNFPHLAAVNSTINTHNTYEYHATLIGFVAPAKTPPDILKRMNEALNSVLKNPDIAKKLDAQGIDVVGGTSDAARVFIDKQMDIWAKVVKDNNIKAD